MTRYHLHITSLQNPRVKDLVRLRRCGERQKRGLYIIEEPLVIERAHRGGVPFAAVYFCPELLKEASAQALLQELETQESGELEFVRLAAPVMEKVSYRDRPAGMLIVARQRMSRLVDLQLSERPLLLVMAGVEKPGNLGALLRCADGAGADAVLLSEPGTDLFNPNVLRASRGALFSVPTVEAEVSEILVFLEDHGIGSIALSPAANRLYTEADLTGPIALIVGAEDTGLSSDWVQRTQLQVRIPMLGQSDSLNVATTAGIVLYEALRQRGRSSYGSFPVR